MGQCQLKKVNRCVLFHSFFSVVKLKLVKDIQIRKYDVKSKIPPRTERSKYVILSRNGLPELRVHLLNRLVVIYAVAKLAVPVRRGEKRF